MELHFTEKPTFNNPTLIAAWPGMGMLARMSADYLIQQLGAKLFAEIRSPSNDIYFKNGVGEISYYMHKFYYKKREKGDLIICSGEIQPQNMNGIYEERNFSPGRFGYRPTAASQRCAIQAWAQR